MYLVLLLWVICTMTTVRTYLVQYSSYTFHPIHTVDVLRVPRRHGREAGQRAKSMDFASTGTTTH